MRIGRKIVISTILALSAAGSILVSSAASATVAQAPAAHTLATHAHSSPSLYYRG